MTKLMNPCQAESPPSIPLVAEHTREPPCEPRAVNEPALVCIEAHLELGRERALGEQRFAGVGRAEEGDVRVVLVQAEGVAASILRRGTRDGRKGGEDGRQATWSLERATSLLRLSGGSSRSAGKDHRSQREIMGMRSGRYVPGRRRAISSCQQRRSPSQPATSKRSRRA